MEGNTVFTNPQAQNVPQNVGLPKTAPQAPPPAPAGNPLPPPPPPSHSSPVGLVIKIVLGLIVLVLIFFALRFAFSLFSSGNENKEVTLTYWGLWEGKDVMEVLINDFEKEHPNIKVEYVKQDIKQYRERLETRIHNGQGPDIFRFHNSWVPMLAGDELIPLSSDVMTTEEFTNIYYPVIKKDLVKNGAIYGIPLSIDTLSLFVNTEIIEAAGIAVPTTWDEFVKASTLMTVRADERKIETSGAALGTYDNITHASDIMAMLLVQNGADEKNLSATQKNAVEALDFYTSFAKRYNVWNDSLDESRLYFAKGKLAMYFGYSWDIFEIQAANPELKFKIYKVPGLPKRNMTIASYWVDGVSAKSKYKKEALLFMDYLAEKSTAEKFYTTAAKTRSFGEPYARKDLRNTLKSNEMIYPFVQQADTAVSTAFSSNTYDSALNDQMNAYVANAIRSLDGNTTKEKAIETLAQGVGRVLQQYGK